MGDASTDLASEDRRLRIGVAAVVGGVWFVSIAPVIVAGSEVHGLVMALWRSLIAFVVLGTVMVIRGRTQPGLARATAPAGICFGLGISLFFWASQLTSVANVTLITVLQAIPLMIAGHWLFGERIRRIDLMWSAVAVGGAVFLVRAADSAGTGDLRGDFVALLSITIGVGYFVFSKRALETVPLLPFMTGMFGWAGLAIAPLVVFSGEALLAPDAGEWVRVFGVALFPGIGHMLMNYAHGRAPLNLMAVLVLLIPVNATLLAYWFVDQSVTRDQVAGMAVVIGALLVQGITRRSEGARTEAIGHTDRP